MVVGIPRHYQLGDAMKDFDDKDLVIFAATIICVASMFLLTDAPMVNPVAQSSEIAPDRIAC